jgi:uncharacterized protein YfeS
VPRKLDPILTSLTHPYGPVGSDRGTDVRHRYEDWREEGRDMATFLAEMCRDWGMPAPDAPPPSEEQLAERIARDDAGQVYLDEAVIAFGFCQLIYEGAVSAADRERALAALDRQAWDCVLAWQGWTDRGQRISALMTMEGALFHADVRP